MLLAKLSSKWSHAAGGRHRWTATIAEPAPVERLTVARTVRFQLVSIPARLVKRSPTLTMRGPARWPWAALFTRRLQAIPALPAPG